MSALILSDGERTNPPGSSRFPRRVALPVVLVIGLLFFSGGSCFFSPESVSVGRLLDWAGCKAFLPEDTGEGSASRECLEYDYDGESVLRLKHVNAGFNCCAEKISAEITFFPGEIRIEESEESAPCDCHCLYDVDYEFLHLKPGIYRIAVTGPYQREDDPPLEFDIDLQGPRTGFICVERNHYPWFQ
jgi:hypothetical protein